MESGEPHRPRSFTFALSLHVTHPSIDPEEVTWALRLTPQRADRVGEPRRGPKGRELGGVYRAMHWYCDVPHGDEAGLVETLKAHLDLLEPHQSFLRSMVSEGGRIYYFIGWFATDRSGGETLDWETLERLANLRISLSFDVYGDCGESQGGQ